MVSAKLSAKTFNVHIEEKAGMFYATSPDIKGLFIAKRSQDEVLAAVPTVVQDLFSACGTRVVVSRLDDNSDGSSWVSIPADIAQAGLDRFNLPSSV